MWGEGSEGYSEDVIRAYMCRYAIPTRLGHDATDEDIARIQTGGPNGWRNDNTLNYWNAVSRAMTEIKNGMTGNKPPANSMSGKVYPSMVSQTQSVKLCML